MKRFTSVNKRRKYFKLLSILFIAVSFFLEGCSGLMYTKSLQDTSVVKNKDILVVPYKSNPIYLTHISLGTAIASSVLSVALAPNPVIFQANAAISGLEDTSSKNTEYKTAIKESASGKAYENFIPERVIAEIYVEELNKTLGTGKRRVLHSERIKVNSTPAYLDKISSSFGLVADYEPHVNEWHTYFKEWSKSNPKGTYSVSQLPSNDAIVLEILLRVIILNNGVENLLTSFGVRLVDINSGEIYASVLAGKFFCDAKLMNIDEFKSFYDDFRKCARLAVLDSLKELGI